MARVNEAIFRGSPSVSSPRYRPRHRTHNRCALEVQTVQAQKNAVGFPTAFFCGGSVSAVLHRGKIRRHQLWHFLFEWKRLHTIFTPAVL